ncbi:nitrogen fixation protein NifQ [Methylacidimicrobium sp. B4]|uniref:nitrogen fixation protein NifQ n=1 Tax=Methylacidimicrobium sp. B4 TaxID=2796139 RepID=UPI001A8D036A|nr:nitrogen fixation protein NifQ [Methylacidimicrobium sp. B4]QSR85209.1 nitrogen fixation protein NifQ [Methylacidimicrobium sp. B4]
MVTCAASPTIPPLSASAPPIGAAEERAMLRGMFRHVVRRFAGRGAFPCVPRLGLDDLSFERLLVFSGAEKEPSCLASVIPEDFWEIASLLVESGNGSEETRWIAHALAAACLADDHLWQDLGLPDRKALSRLLERHFRPLRDQNVGDMRWKKFFYRQLCERAGFQACKAPSCRECTDYAICFGKD